MKERTHTGRHLLNSLLFLKFVGNIRTQQHVSTFCVLAFDQPNNVELHHQLDKECLSLLIKRPQPHLVNHCSLLHPERVQNTNRCRRSTPEGQADRGLRLPYI